MNSLNRRHFLQMAALGLSGTMVSQVTGGEPARLPATSIDAHTHFYDPARPQGVPWPGKDDKLLYRTVLPGHFLKAARPVGVNQTIVVEASPWLEDNQWLLHLAAREPAIIAVVGNLDMLADDFARNLRRFAKAARFRGIRVNHAVLQKGLEQKRFRAHVKLLVENNLELDVNGGPAMAADVARLAERFPQLRIVINHAGNLPLDGKAPPATWRKGMEAAARQHRVYCKVSALVEGTGRKKVPTDIAFYRPVLDALWGLFGEDRLIYGSNWPVSERFASYATVFNIVRGYFQGRGKAALDKFFCRNARLAYLGERK